MSEPAARGGGRGIEAEIRREWARSIRRAMRREWWGTVQAGFVILVAVTVGGSFFSHYLGGAHAISLLFEGGAVAPWVVLMLVSLPAMGAARLAGTFAGSLLLRPGLERQRYFAASWNPLGLRAAAFLIAAGAAYLALHLPAAQSAGMGKKIGDGPAIYVLGFLAVLTAALVGMRQVVDRRPWVLLDWPCLRFEAVEQVIRAVARVVRLRTLHTGWSLSLAWLAAAVASGAAAYSRGAAPGAPMEWAADFAALVAWPTFAFRLIVERPESTAPLAAAAVLVATAFGNAAVIYRATRLTAAEIDRRAAELWQQRETLAGEPGINVFDSSTPSICWPLLHAEPNRVVWQHFWNVENSECDGYEDEAGMGAEPESDAAPAPPLPWSGVMQAELTPAGVDAAPAYREGARVFDLLVDLEDTWNRLAPRGIPGRATAAVAPFLEFLVAIGVFFILAVCLDAPRTSQAPIAYFAAGLYVLVAAARAQRFSRILVLSAHLPARWTGLWRAAIRRHAIPLMGDAAFAAAIYVISRSPLAGGLTLAAMPIIRFATLLTVTLRMRERPPGYWWLAPVPHLMLGWLLLFLMFGMMIPIVTLVEKPSLEQFPGSLLAYVIAGALAVAFLGGIHALLGRRDGGCVLPHHKFQDWHFEAWRSEF